MRVNFLPAGWSSEDYDERNDTEFVWTPELVQYLCFANEKLVQHIERVSEEYGKVMDWKGCFYYVTSWSRDELEVMFIDTWRHDYGERKYLMPTRLLWDVNGIEEVRQEKQRKADEEAVEKARLTKEKCKAAAIAREEHDKAEYARLCKKYKGVK
ncbi:MAG: hypothetical protein JSS66_07640 [Armatimonadetes bacterium]|nr:hypothetical protein [Armatimonadota bacterium]